MRLTESQILDIEKKYGVDRLYSWNRVNCFNTSLYEYFLSYVKKIKGDIPDTSYNLFGRGCHSLLEGLYTGNIQNEDLYSRFNEMWEENLSKEKLNFCRYNDSRNNSIAEKYRENVGHFFKNYKKVTEAVEVEKFLIAKLDRFVFQGYADALVKGQDGKYTIVDWKTSSMYSKKDLEKNSGQLIFYAVALNQSGIPIEDIKCCFCFLKYCTIVVEKEVNGSIKTSEITIERSKIGEYDGIKEIKDCVVYVDMKKENVDKVVDYLIRSANEIERLEESYNKTGDESIFYDSEENIRDNYYYFTNLCKYSRKLHKPLNEYMNGL